MNKKIKNLLNLVPSQHWPSVLYFVKGWKGGEYQGEVYLSILSSQQMKGLDEGAQAKSGYYSEDSSIISNSWRGEQTKSLFTVSVSLSQSCFAKQHWAGLEHNWKSNWLHLLLSDNSPGEEMKSWKFILCNFGNYYSEMGSHLLA